MRELLARHQENRFDAGIEVEVPPKYDIIQPDHAFLLSVPDTLRHRRIVDRGHVGTEHRAFLQMEMDCDVFTQFSGLNLRIMDNTALCVESVLESILRFVAVGTLAGSGTAQDAAQRHGKTEDGTPTK